MRCFKKIGFIRSIRVLDAAVARQSAELSASLVFAVASVAVESGLRMSPGGGRKVKRPWAHNLLGRDVPTRTADPVGTKYVEGFAHTRS